MKITREFVHQGKSIFGGWSRKQVESIGGQWPLHPGWIDALVGREIPEEAAAEFLRLKDAHIDQLDLQNHTNREHLRAIAGEKY